MKAPAKPSLASQLILYAEQVSTNASLIAESLEAQNARPTDVIPPELSAARLNLIEAAFQLLKLSHDTGSFLINLTVDYQVICAFKWLCHFNIPNLVPANGTIDYVQLAQASGAPERILRSALGLVMGSGLFEEPEAGCVGHSMVSRQIALDESLSHWAQYISSTIIPTAAKHLEAIEKWPGSRQVNETAHNIAFGHKLSYFDFVSQDTSRGAQFARTMQAISSTSAFDSGHLMRSYDWGLLGEGVVVDMGGSTGHASIALAEAFPYLTFIVQDLPEVTVDNAQHFQERKLDKSVSSRIKFQEHSFFDPQPVKAASIYLLRHILHDWPDKEAVQILRNILPALGPKSRILVSDIVLPEESGVIPVLEERVMRLNDMLLHQFTNTSERTLRDWKGVFAQVGTGLRILRVYRHPRSVLSLIELGR
ncbi:O-methyltransferase [Aspergillus foveolatus]|uniref:O-methyltransferase n=1 Tax=Aspergillus foveolatus TaxID=210207 RepID=UPI003CCD52BD